MAAPAVKMVGVSELSSSDEDDEELRRCQEAVWETRGDPKKKDGDTSVQQSKRLVVADHEHDGNELQVTEGFRTHVAKKLGTLLDSCITETQTQTSSCVESAKCDDDDDDDEGFRLFSTSLPGQTAEDPPAPVRRRPVPSSSDSDSEMETRLKEAAVSIKDLLPSSSLPSAPSEEPPCSEKIKKKKKKKVAEEEESCVVKKKKKRKQNKEENDSAGSPLKAQSNGENRSSEQEHTQVKVKRKKKKKREGNREEEEEALN